MGVHEHRPRIAPADDSWKELGACVEARDPDIFYPGKGKPVQIARRICASCPVTEECLAFALEIPPADDWGVWGGTSSGQRRAMRKALTRAS